MVVGVHNTDMNTLHLFAGAGGGIIADMMLGHTPVGAVEIDDYCFKVLEQRQKDGWLPKFPIFRDVREFDGAEISECVDCVCGGFPCQDISCAGKGGASAERDLVSFTNLSGYVATYDHPTSSWKTVRSSSPEVSIPFCGKFPKWGTMRNGVVYQRPRLGRGIEGNAGGACAKNRIMFPTPSTMGLRGGAHASDALWRMMRQTLITEEELIAMGGNRPGKQNTQDGGKLNPDWVEWLMGWPIGWTALKPLETVKSPLAP